MNANDQNAAPMIDISRSQIRADQQPNAHEPDCPHSGMIGHCITCMVARAAYKRGREDAARATGAYVISNLDNRLETADFLDGLWKAAQETTIED